MRELDLPANMQSIILKLPYKLRENGGILRVICMPSVGITALSTLMGRQDASRNAIAPATQLRRPTLKRGSLMAKDDHAGGPKFPSGQ